MPKASEVAIELRKLADALDKHPDTILSKPDLTFWQGTGDDAKALFLAAARILPNPKTKNYPTDTSEYSRVSVEHSTPALDVSSSIYRNSICHIVKPAQPAEYNCELTLSEEEESSLTEA